MSCRATIGALTNDHSKVLIYRVATWPVGLKVYAAE